MMNSNSPLDSLRHGNHELDKLQQLHHNIEYLHHNNQMVNSMNQHRIGHQVNSCQLDEK